MTQIYNRPLTRPFSRTSTQVLKDRHLNLDEAIRERRLHPDFLENDAKLMKLRTKLELIRRAKKESDQVAIAYGVKRKWQGFVTKKLMAAE